MSDGTARTPDRSRLLAVARGDQAADLVLRNARVVNVFSGEILHQDVAVADGRIAAVGEVGDGDEAMDLEGRFLLPGLIDAHVHIESSMVTPYEFARAVVPRGTTTVVCDPHEIANVAGLAGIHWLLEASEGLPLQVLVMAPSCVPATALATAGAELDATALATLRGHPRVLGLGEVMNVPGVVLGDEDVEAKLEAFAGTPIDGHAPAVSGAWLNAYAAAGIASDHECVGADEAREKLRLGMRVFLREGSGAKNLRDLLPVASTASSRRCALCSDDRHPHDLLEEGHVDHLLRIAVEDGIDPVTAVQMATLNAAEAFGLGDRGAIAPGRRADMVVCSDLDRFNAEQVFAGGLDAAVAGRPCGQWRPPVAADHALRGGLTVDLEALDLRVTAASTRVRVIGVEPGQITTRHLVERLPARDGTLACDPERDIAKLAVIERHHGSGRVGLGFVHGLGLRRGAIAGTVAHDHHNLIVAGADDRSIKTAAAALVAAAGGLVAAEGSRVLALLPLPLGGLMSDRPVEAVRDRLDLLVAAARGLGSPLADPWMTLSFLGLEVIPALRLSDRGVVDSERFELVPLAAE